MISESESQPQRPKAVRVYVDGFNLYHAIATLKNHKLKWINLWRLSETFLRAGEVLDKVNFFTAVLTWDADKCRRHMNFIEACHAFGITVHIANFKKSYKICQEYERRCKFFEEKQTDVAIAVSMVSDALSGTFDRGILITADSDQIPTAKFISALPNRQLSLVYPPGRAHMARDLGNIIPDRKELTEGRLQSCIMPKIVCDRQDKVVAQMPAFYEDIG